MAFSSRSFDYSSDRLIPCVVLDGPPTEKTDGAIGVLCIDRESGNLYVCVSADYCDRMFTWKIVGDVSEDMIRQSVSDFLSQNPVSGSLSDAEKDMLLTLFRGAVYQSETAEETAAAYSKLQNLWSVTANPDITPDVSMTGISAVYSGGDVAVGTAVTDLTGIVVTAHYSDGTSETVTGYTLSGEIAEGGNTITVSYEGKTTTFTVTGVAESAETVIEMGSWGACGDYQYNGGAMYADDGTSGETISFGSGASTAMLSNMVFEADTKVNIALTWEIAGYDSFAVGSSNSDTVSKKIVMYHAIKAGKETHVDTGTTTEIAYTVKAGYRLAIMARNGFTGSVKVTAAEV